MSHTVRRYRPDIDGLRALAVAVVLVFHAFPARLPGGFVGVDIFFVISGYLITGIVLKATAAGRFSFVDFYARRIRRIFPALAAVLTAVLVAGWFLLYADDYARASHHVMAAAAFASNFAFWKESSYFDVAADLKPLLHLWSIGVEEQFYLVWPLVLVAVARWRRGPLAATLAIGTISLLLAIWTVRIDRTPAFYAPWNRFWELLAGAMLACIEVDIVFDGRLQRVLARRRLPDLLAMLGVAAIVAGVSLIDSTRVFPGLWVMLPVGGTVLLVLAGPKAWLNRIVFSQPMVVWIGLISYPLYLWHWPLLSFAHLLWGGVPPASLRIALLIVSVILAWATYRVIERPIRFGPPRSWVVPALTISMTTIAVAGAWVSFGGGLIDRPVNRNDAARLIDYYERLHKTGLAAAYRFECDFLDATTERVRDALAPSCTTPGSRHTVLLWGDSFAQALSLGLRESLPVDTSLAQVATSACKAGVEDFDLSVADRRCEKANLFAIQTITALRPELVIIAHSGGHRATDWRLLTSRVLALGAGRVVVVGPFPQWRPSLPRVYAEHHLADLAEYVAVGLDLESFETDQAVAASVRDLAGVTFVSLLDQLCRDRACLARVPGEGDRDLMAVDAGHLSPKGSSYLGRKIWQPYFDRVIR